MAIISNGKPSIQGATRDGKRERSFELSLPTLVIGTDAFDHKFREKTLLASISAQQAILRLKTRVLIGSQLRLFLDIPQTLILGKTLKLILSGSVVLVETDSAANGQKQLVAVRLDKRFKIEPLLSTSS